MDFKSPTLTPNLYQSPTLTPYFIALKFKKSHGTPLIFQFQTGLQRRKKTVTVFISAKSSRCLRDYIRNPWADHGFRQIVHREMTQEIPSIKEKIR
ncbi:unnamed protein product [Cuscuta campestris]|uniref:Uncharacterized protein n=1 Tax=Cuscuta campestris TaxID=132261 RepID=A0A484NI61_9ASTE|nr:unnamed protein product [Cuscuta campestris]